MKASINNQNILLGFTFILTLVLLAAAQFMAGNETTSNSFTSQWTATETSLDSELEVPVNWHQGHRALLGMTQQHLLFQVQFTQSLSDKYLVVTPAYLDTVTVKFYNHEKLLANTSKGDRQAYDPQNYQYDIGRLAFAIPAGSTSAVLDISSTETLQASITLQDSTQLNQSLLFSTLFKSAILTIIALTAITSLAASVYMQQRLYAIFGLHQLVWFSVLLALSGLIPRIWPTAVQLNGDLLGFFTITATLSGSVFHWHILNHLMQKKWQWLGSLFKIAITFTLFNLFVYLFIDQALGLILNVITSFCAMAILLTVLPITSANDRLQALILSKVKWPYVLLILLAMIAALGRLGIGNGVHMPLLYIHALFSMILLGYITLLRSIVLRRREASLATKTKLQAASISQLSNNLDEQSSLLSMLAQEIKTPLTTLKLLIFKSPIRAALNQPLANIEHIVDTVALMDSVKMGPQVYEQIDLASLVEGQWQHATSIMGNDQQMQLHKQGNTVCLGNRWALSIIFNNLIGNAIKYSTSPIIDIAVQQQQNKIQVVIKNQCVDLSPDEKYALTNNYFRAANKSGDRGTGLGLWVSKTLSEANNCSLHLVQSNGEFMAMLEIYT